MKLKRFVAKDMRQALAKIKEELGAEAVIMSNKRIEGGVEIIAGVEETITPHSTPIEPSTTNTITSKAAKDNGPGLGVRVREITKDTEQGRMVYDPTHPDAIQSGPNKGYVEYPNVNIVNEMVDMISANRAYEANSSVIQGSKEMFASALDIGSR